MSVNTAGSECTNRPERWIQCERPREACNNVSKCLIATGWYKNFSMRENRQCTNDLAVCIKFTLNVWEVKNKYHEAICYLSWLPFLTQQITCHFVPLLQYWLKYVHSDSLHREYNHNIFTCSALLYTAGGSDSRYWATVEWWLAMEKLKWFADKSTPLPVVSSRTKYQHTSNSDLSITNECAKMWGQHWLVFTVQSVPPTRALSNITVFQFVQVLECHIRWIMANIYTFFRWKFLHITPSLPPYENGNLKNLPLCVLTWHQYYRYHQTVLRANKKGQNAVSTWKWGHRFQHISNVGECVSNITL
jgi:hypothetical protein